MKKLEKLNKKEEVELLATPIETTILTKESIRELNRNYVNKIYELIEWEQQNKFIWNKKAQKIYETIQLITKNEDFFKLWHIEEAFKQCKYEFPHILIISTEKNVGKTTEIYSIIKKEFDKGNKVFYGRALKADLDGARDNFLREDEASFYIDDKKRTWKVFNKANGEYGGIAFSLQNCQGALGGTNYKEFTLGIIDEFVSYHTSGYITLDRIKLNWTAFFSSIVRLDHPGFRMILFGNNVATKNRGILDYYGIKPNEDVAYLERGHPINWELTSRIFYINLIGFYKGINEQGGAAQHMHPELAEAYKTNTIHYGYENLIEPKIYETLNVWFLLAFTISNKPYLLQCKSYKRNNKLLFLAIQIVELKVFHRFKNHKVLCEEKFWANEFRALTFFNTINPWLMKIRLAISQNILFYYDVLTQELIRKYLTIKFGRCTP